MEVTVLGSGTSQGVPMIGCTCGVCMSSDPRNKRTRASIHVVMDGCHIQVDAAPEFRLQCVREGVHTLDVFILTHGHADHIAGMDDLRRFCDLRSGEALDIYTSVETAARVAAVYPYAMLDRAMVRGYPAFRVREMPGKLELPQGTIESTLLPHGEVQTLGLVFTERSSGRRFAYYTDCKRIPGEAVELARGSHAAILDGLRPQPHPSHMSIAEAVEAGKGLGIPHIWLTHLTHLTDHEELEKTLPEGFQLAYDGLKITV
jgi:phosphoribosyl 1,2-cyclic phosphate phosphodiesterase